MSNEAVKRAFAGAADALLSKEDRDTVYQRQRGLCFTCNRPIYDAVIYGHLIPRSRGGKHEHSNRIGLHSICERDRGDRLPTEAEVAKQHELSTRNRS